MITRIMYVTVLAIGLLIPENSTMAGSRKETPNDMSLELLGKCLLYSFSYQRMLGESFGLDVAVSMLGSGSSGSSSSILFFTGGGRVYFLDKNASPFIGGGFVAVSSSTSSGPFSSSNSDSYAYLTPGFEYRSEGGFLVRGSVYALIANGGFFIWPGLTVGVAF